MIDLLIHGLSITVSATVFAAAMLALNRMSRQTAWPIQLSYVAMFAGSGMAALLAVWELLSGDSANHAMHLAMLITVAGLSMLMLASRRRDCMCPDCPARRRPDDCDSCDQRGGQPNG